MMRVTYLGHSGFLLEMEDALFLFDYYQGSLPEMDPEKTLFVFVSHVHYDHYNPDILKLRRQRQNIWYLFSDDVPMPDEQKQVIRLSPEEERRVNGIRVRTLPSTDEGVAFWIEYHGIVIYHAGDLNWWHWEGEPKSYNVQMRADYQKAIRELPDQPIDVAFVPADLRLGEQYVWGLDYFMRHTDTKMCSRCISGDPMKCLTGFFTNRVQQNIEAESERFRQKDRCLTFRVRHSIMKNSVK